MKKLTLILTAFMFSLTASSQVGRWFYPPVNCYVNGFSASCQTTNYTFRPIFCSAQASAQTSFGYFLTGFYNGWIQPGLTGYITINANNPYRDPIVNAYADARCRF